MTQSLRRVCVCVLVADVTTEQHYTRNVKKHIGHILQVRTHTQTCKYTLPICFHVLDLIDFVSGTVMCKGQGVFAFLF